MSDLTLKISILYALLFLSINCPSYILKARSFIGEIEKDSIYLFKFMTSHFRRRYFKRNLSLTLLNIMVATTKSFCWK